MLLDGARMTEGGIIENGIIFCMKENFTFVFFQDTIFKLSLVNSSRVYPPRGNLSEHSYWMVLE